MDVDKANELRALIVKLQEAQFDLIKDASYYDEWIAASNAVEAFITNHTE